MLLTFEQIDCESAEFNLVGKKAQSLIQMTQWGLPVPSGCVITLDSFDHFCEENQLFEDVQRLRVEVKEGNPQAIKHAQEVQRRIMDSPLPQSLMQSIENYLLQHPTHHFALRSSGNKEDLKDSSFAGLYTSVLNIKGLDAFIDALKQCWASLFNDRVISYCQNKSINYDDMGLAVIAQQMVSSEKSGVIFTVNPLSGLDTEMVIEACFGVGEALVSGQVTPDNYCYNWYERVESKRDISDKRVRMVPISQAPFIVTEENEPRLATSAVLDPADVELLVAVALKVQQHYGFPVDVEWAYAAGTFYIVQSRPITQISYGAIPGEWTTADFKDGGVSSTVCSRFMWSLYDLIWENELPEYLLRVHLIKENSPKRWGDMFFGRPYWFLTPVKEGLLRLPGFVERHFDEDLGIQVAYEGEGRCSKTNVKTIFHALNVLSAFEKSFKEQLAFCPDFVEQQRAKLETLDTLALEKMDRDELFSLYGSFINEEYYLSEASYFTLIFNNSNATSIFKDSLRKYKKDANYTTLLSGLSGLSHLKPNFRLYELSRLIKGDSQALSHWNDSSIKELVHCWAAGDTSFYMDEVAAFIEEYKYHSVRELDITVPRYGEDPSFVMESVKNYIQLSDDRFSPQQMNNKQGQRSALAQKELLQSVPFYSRKKVANKLKRWREFLWWREELRDYSTQYYYQVRRFTLAVAKQLQNQGVIGEVRDIFNLPVEQVIALTTGELSSQAAQHEIERNKIYYESFRNFKNPDEIGKRYTGSTRSTVSIENADNSYSGVPCSAGVVTGRARVIKDIYDSNRIEQGDILITRFTDPGWTPKFSLIAAVATETGGLLSHAAVISREYGIPAVLAIPELTDRIKDGDQVMVNGNTGQVTVE